MASRGASSEPGGSAWTSFSVSTSTCAADVSLDSYGISGMAARDLFDWMASRNCTVALNVYMTPHMPTYVFWLPKDLRLLAQGQLASRA